jgi:hypothetical protein
MASNRKMLNELERIWKEAVETCPRHNSGSYVEEVRSKQRKLSQDIRCPVLESNGVPPEYV